MPIRYTVSGKVHSYDSQPIAGILVRAFDKDLPSLNRDEILGETITNADGEYEICFTDASLRQRKASGPDIYITVFDRSGAEVGRSETVCSPDCDTQIDLCVADGKLPRQSEYEILLEKLLPLVRPLTLSDLTGEDVHFLTRAAAVEHHLVEWLRVGAQLAKRTGVPAEGFYGWARHQPPLPREWSLLPHVPDKDADQRRELIAAILRGLVVAPPESSKAALLSAVECGIIPASLCSQIDDIVRQLTRSQDLGYRLIGRLRYSISGAPLGGLTVRTFDLYRDGEELGRQISTGEGLFTVDYSVPADGKDRARKFRFVVLDTAGADLLDTTVEVTPGQSQTIELAVPRKIVPDPPDHVLTNLAKAVNLSIPAALLKNLQDAGINALADIRARGGLAHVSGLDVPASDPVLQVLDAHADLSRLSPDVSFNAQLIGKGYRSVTDVGEAALGDFVSATYSTVGDFQAAKLHVDAQGRASFLKNLLTGIAANQASGQVSPIPGAADLAPDQCECDDCEAAVSPAAYLADLLAYAIKHFKQSGGGIDIQLLQNTFFQPFGDLPTDCDAVGQLVRQVRIAVEVLRAYLALNPATAAAATALGQAEKDYRFTAYTLFLHDIGSSWDEIRLARTATPEIRAALAERLGFGLTVPRPDPGTTPGDELDQLYLDPDAPAGNFHELTEGALELLFGLQDTTRDPLSQGHKVGDVSPAEVFRWGLAGARWNQNTDRDGAVYLEFKTVAGTALTTDVSVYRDAARTQLVASGSGSVVSGDRVIKIVPRNSSGLSGMLGIRGTTADNTSVLIVQVPRLLTWRLQHLRELWLEQDFPTDVYSPRYQPAAERLPVIDPDVIGPDDFRHPAATNAAFAIWIERRQWVDARLKDFAALTRVVTVGGQSFTVPDLDKILARMYLAVNYGAASVQPWPASTPVTAFDALYESLSQGSVDDVAAARDQIAATLTLTVDGFSRIIVLRDKHRLWLSEPQNEPVAVSEWNELFSILVEVEKTKFRAVWIAEENTAGLVFGPGDFWPCLREPKDGDWPFQPVPGTPLIDPDLVKPSDLAESTVGQAALDLRDARVLELAQATRDIRAKREASGFEAMLRLAIGNPGPNNPLQHDVDTLKANLASSNPATVATAKQQITGDLRLTLDSFNRMIAVRAKDADPVPSRRPTQAEWAEVYGLLTTAHKLKHLYAAWIAQESTAGFDTATWKVIKAALPPWRASAEDRQLWKQGLTVRSAAPAIDPDLVAFSDLNLPFAQAALTIWQNRSAWFSGRVAALGAAPKTLAGFDSIVAASLEIPIADFLAVDINRNAGQSIEARLSQLTVSSPAFDYLLRIRELLNQGQTVIQKEWDSVASILVEVEKQRHFAQWRIEEQSAGVTLSPDSLKLPEIVFPPPPPRQLDPWRATLEAFFNWQDSLQARIDSESSIIAALHDAVGTVEGNALPGLRDALVLATSSSSGTLETPAKWATERFFLDAEVGGCQKTTRISQAIETIQGVLFSIRTGLSATAKKLLFSLDAPDFDEEWKWIGSYAPWRSAVFVFLYPENIAIPSLRRRQTPGFQTLIASLRSEKGITPEQACGLAGDFASYYEDIARLVLGATCQAEVVYRSGSKCEPGTIGRKPLIFMFGRGGVTGKIYFSTFDPEDTTGYAQTFWDTIPAISPGSQIIGAAPYERLPSDRLIYLFVRSLDHKLQFATFNLETTEWSDLIDLALPPGDPNYLEVVINQTNYLQYPPSLVMRTSGDFYVRRISNLGGVWEDGDWPRFKLDNNALNLNNIDQLLACLDGVLWIRRGGTLQRRYTAGLSSSTLSPPERVNAIYIGSVLWGVAKNDWGDWLVEKQTSGAYYDEGYTDGGGYPINSPTIADQFPLQGLSSIVPNCGSGKYVSFGYQRESDAYFGGYYGGYYGGYITSFDGPVGSFFGAGEPSGVYLRLDLLDNFLAAAPGLRIKIVRIAPRVIPYVPGQFLIPARLEGSALQARQQMEILVLVSNSDSLTNRTLPEEAYFFTPLAIADALERQGEYVAALDWYRTVYDYIGPAGLRKIYYGLVQEESLPELYKRAPDWLLDPLDPHAIASTRHLAYTRFTLLAIIRCLLDFADSEYTMDTAESLPRARSLYMTALDLLDSDELKQRLNGCDAVIGELTVDLGPDPPPYTIYYFADLKDKLKSIGSYASIKDVTPRINALLSPVGATTSLQSRLAAAHDIVEQATMASPSRPSVGAAATERTPKLARASMLALRDPDVEQAAAGAGAAATARFLSATSAVSGVAPDVLQTQKISLPFLRRTTAPSSTTAGPDFVLSSGLLPLAPATSLSVSVLLPPSDLSSTVNLSAPDRDQLSGLLLERSPIVFRPYTVNPAPGPFFEFCIPPNPLLNSLRLHAELNLHKLRTCRNIAGLKRDVDPYSAPTDTVSGLPSIGASGQLVLPGASVIRPTLYRYQTLIQRAKDLVQLATQLEASMLSALEKRDAEAYSVLRARQDLETAQAQVQLEVLRLKQANDSVTLAVLQQGRVQIQADHYQKLLDDGPLESERGAIETLGEAAILQATSADLSFAAAAVYGAVAVAGAVAGGVAGASAGPGGIAGGGVVGAVAGALSGGLGGVASGLSALSQGYSGLAAKRATRAQIQLTLASFERRQQDWELQNAVAKQDVAIGEQQVSIATDGVDIAQQEKTIADIHNTQARDTVEFLTNKFTNVELYDWMSGVLQDVYSFFLQQATAMARLAQNQLAFERQEPSPNYVQPDYWDAPGDLLSLTSLANTGPDRRGLTGSERLLQDIYRLDQYSFETNKRKQQLTKTISLAQLAPVEFQRFRELGSITIATPMEMFDREFPGHYLRLIKRVRTSVVALIPPTQGIRATLSNAGISRTVVGPDVFQTVAIQRDPDSVALTSPMNSTGLFELESQPDILFPFEGCGVDSVWDFRMQLAANPIDFRTVADVLITFEYTSLISDDYYQQVTQTLRPTLDGDRPFSFRTQFADQWYDLHNPDQTSTPMMVRFQTVAEDFPVNLDSVKIQHLALYFSRAAGKSFEIAVTSLRYKELGMSGSIGGAAISIDGFISTRSGNAGSWTAMQGKSPFGEWELSLPNTDEMRGRFQNDDIEEILFVISYSGRTPNWSN